MEYHQGLYLSPAQGNPSPVESRKAHMVYLEKKKYMCLYEQHKQVCEATATKQWNVVST